MEGIEIQKVTIKDIYKLQKISIHTFTETFSSVNTKENMVQYLEDSFSISKLTDELENINSEFYFALHHNTIIGYLKIRFADSQNENSVEIERIYVLKEYHGKSVGQLLLNKAIQITKMKNSDFIWLGVWEENPRAITFYKKNGFQAYDKHIFKLGDDEQIDILMKRNLKTGIS